MERQWGVHPIANARQHFLMLETAVELNRENRELRDGKIKATSDSLTA
jgi:hypothetical protein